VASNATVCYWPLGGDERAQQSTQSIRVAARGLCQSFRPLRRIGHLLGSRSTQAVRIA